jgi:hypothetical protein
LDDININHFVDIPQAKSALQNSRVQTPVAVKRLQDQRPVALLLGAADHMVSSDSKKNSKVY